MYIPIAQLVLAMPRKHNYKGKVLFTKYQIEDEIIA